jgi:hypothetical protein
MLELKANYHKLAMGVVIESELSKGRGCYSSRSKWHLARK